MGLKDLSKGIISIPALFLVKEAAELVVVVSAEVTGVIDTEGLISEPIFEDDDDEVAVKKM